MDASRRGRVRHRLLILALLGTGLLLAPAATQGAVSGTVVAWGCGGGNDFGQCTVPDGLAGVTAIAAGSYHSLALKGDGTVVAWGCRGRGLVGPCNIPVGLSSVTAIAAGTDHNLALRVDGSVVAWGCGSSSAGNCSVPDGLTGVIAIAAGAYHSLALKRDGTIVAWGCGPDQLGHGRDVGQCSVPAGLSGVTAISAGLAYHSLALKSDGSVIGWGCIAGPDFFGPSFGQCGEPKFAPVAAIAAGFAHNLAVGNDRKVVAWGCGGNFNLGQCSVPSGLAGVTAIAASLYHSVALIGPMPSIGLLSARASGEVAVVKVKISGWKLYPTLIGRKPNKLDGGHWRIVVDGKPNSSSANSTAGRTTKLKPGKHKIWVKLVNNDNSDVAGTRPSRPLTVVVKRRG
jgi:hypothetical protein